MKRTSAAAAATILVALMAGPTSAQPPTATDKPTIAPSASLTPPPDAPPPHPVAPGPYAVSVIAEPSLMTHTVYRPSDLSPFKGNNRLPIVAWGNGACSNAGLLFQTFLTEIASHGFMVIVSGPKDAPLPAFASQRPGQSAAPSAPAATAGAIPAAMTKDADLITAIDWAIKETARKDGSYFGKLNPDKVAVMGQSCGGLQATAIAADPRIKTVVIWNSGVFPEGGASPGARLSGASKASIDKFHAPIAYFLGGPTDLAYANGKDDFSRIKSVPAFLGSIHSGHGGTYNQPGGGWFGEVGVAWLKWRLNGDKAAAKYFEGGECLLCKDPIWEVAKKNMK
jgi:dienelactone hydrolase